MAEEYSQVSEHEGANGEWISRDYEKTEDGIPPDAFDDARLFKEILVYTDEDGNKHYVSTNVFENLDEADEAAEVLEGEYEDVYGGGGSFSVVIRAYF